MPRGPKPKDFTGEIHGCWKVIERDKNPKSKSHATFWISECQNCGNIASVRKEDLDKNPRSCNKCKGDIISKIFDDKGLRSWKIGDKYGLLTIIGKGTSKSNHTYVKVQCDCGSEPFEVRLEHLKGQNCRGKTISCGCSSKSSGEIKIARILKENNVIFEEQYRISDFSKFALFDFAIFDRQHNLIKLIEYDGEQHFKPIDFFGGEEKFKQQQENDRRKDSYCLKNGIKLTRISYADYDNINLEMLLS